MDSSKNNIKISGWAVIPTHILSKILVMSGMPADEVVCNVALVCRSWWQALSGPYYWSNVDLYEWCRRGHQTAEIDETVKMFVARSAGILRSLSVYKIGEAAFTYACYRPVKILVLSSLILYFSNFKFLLLLGSFLWILCIKLSIKMFSPVYITVGNF